MTRIQRLREKAYRTGMSLRYDEKSLLFYRGVRANEKEPYHNVKRAKVIAYLFEHCSIAVDEDELLVGRYPDRALTEEEREELACGNRYLQGAGMLAGAAGAGTGHRVADYEKVLGIGIKGILEEIAGLESNVDDRQGDSVRKRHFYEACRISLGGLLRFAGRYRERLEELRGAEVDPARKREYEKLADIFGRIPYLPARSFHEALQCVWFLQFSLSFADDISLTGRPDNYLYPYYQKGIADGTLTRDSAMELIECLYLKTNEIYNTWPGSLMVGGLDRQGRPVENELTHMCIRAVATTGLINPAVALSYTERTSDELLALCADVISRGFTKPAIFNDRVVTAGLLDAGMGPEDARYYIHSTCVEITPIGCSNIQVATPYVDMIKGIEFLLNGGREIYEGDHRIYTGMFNPGIAFELDGLTTFGRFYECYKAILAGIIKNAVRYGSEQAQRLSSYASCPLMSCFISDCLQKGLDSGAGGARYNYCYPCFPGFSSTVDSLSAVRQAVYETRAVTLAELKEALEGNFEGRESLRQYLLNRCPKFGCDDDRADALAADLYDFIRGELRQYRNCLGGTFHPSYFSWIMHGELGKLTAASADGRLRGEALSECLGSVQGMDRKGPMAVVRSVAKLEQKYGIGGIATNFRFAGSMLSTDEGKTALVHFIREFMDQGGFEMQFNTVDQATLLDAKAHPEKYRTLMVRVAGYSDYFTNLDPVIQDEIIKRTQHEGI